MIRVVAVCAAWLAISVGGMFALESHKAKPGEPGAAPETWPSASAISRANDVPTLVLFAHPRCPCTSASLTELEKIGARLGRRIAIRVLFIAPAGTPSGWEKSDLWTKAARIPGADVFTDEGSGEAARFGSVTSGQVALYSAAGTRLFQGGITSSRGHEGDNLGADRVISLVTTEGVSNATTPVFGCPLVTPGSEPR